MGIDAWDWERIEELIDRKAKSIAEEKFFELMSSLEFKLDARERGRYQTEYVVEIHCNKSGYSKLNEFSVGQHSYIPDAYEQ